VVGFSTASINDYDRTRDAFRRARQTCADLRLPVPELLGVIYSGYNRELPDVHGILYNAYTRTHEDPDRPGTQESPWVTDLELGFLQTDEKDVARAEAAKSHTMLTFAPTSEYADAAWQLVLRIAGRYGVPSRQGKPA